MNDFHSDYCIVGNSGPLESCSTCTAEMKHQQRYYRSGYRPEYTEAEVMDVYSEPCESAKREILIERLGL